MPRSAKPEPGSQAVNLKKLKPFSTKFDRIKSDQNDARSDMGLLYEQIGQDGFNTHALKLAMRIRGMESTKRTIFLEDLNAYLRELGCFSAPGLFSDPQSIGPDKEEKPEGESMGAYQLGYAEGLKGALLASSPFDEEDSPVEAKDYERGWLAGQSELAGVPPKRELADAEAAGRA